MVLYNPCMVFYTLSIIYNMFLKLAQGCILWIIGAFMFHIIAVLFGAPFVESAHKTFQFGCLLSLLTILPCCIVLGFDSNNWLRLFTTNSPHNEFEIVVHTCTISAILGAWFGAFPIPLDWDRPWQEWPISCVIGALGGYLIGLLLSAAKIALLSVSRPKDKTKFV